MNDGRERRLLVASLTIKFKNYNKNISISIKVREKISHTMHMIDILVHFSSIFLLKSLFSISLRLYLFWLRTITTVMTETITVIAFNL